MTSFRIRSWGSTDWVQIDILDGDDEDLGESVADDIRDELSQSHLHVQELTEGKWEDL